MDFQEPLLPASVHIYLCYDDDDDDVNDGGIEKYNWRWNKNSTRRPSEQID